MKALSVLQPWASLTVIVDPKTGKACKQIETRSRNTSHRGPLLIHASISFKALHRDLCLTEPFFSAIKRSGLLMRDHTGCHMYGRYHLPLGAIIGMVNVVDSFPVEALTQNGMRMHVAEDGNLAWLTEQELAFGDYSPGRYGYLLSDPVVFAEPIPAKGMLGLWTPDDETMIKVNQALAATEAA